MKGSQFKGETLGEGETRGVGAPVGNPLLGAKKFRAIILRRMRELTTEKSFVQNLLTRG